MAAEENVDGAGVAGKTTETPTDTVKADENGDTNTTVQSPESKPQKSWEDVRYERLGMKVNNLTRSVNEALQEFKKASTPAQQAASTDKMKGLLESVKETLADPDAVFDGDKMRPLLERMAEAVEKHAAESPKKEDAGKTTDAETELWAEEFDLNPQTPPELRGKSKEVLQAFNSKMTDLYGGLKLDDTALSVASDKVFKIVLAESLAKYKKAEQPKTSADSSGTQVFAKGAKSGTPSTSRESRIRNWDFRDKRNS